MSGRARLAGLISGRGRNLQAMIDAVGAGHIDADWAVVISNKADAYGLQRAEAAGIATVVLPHADYPDREAFDQALGDVLEAHRPDIIVMAGFMRILGPAFVRRFAGRMINIHPSLLPKYRGLNTHQRALDAGDAEHGASVHFVTEELDGGPVAVQGRFRVRPEDDASTLADRVMQEIELKIYPQAVAWLASGDLRWQADGLQFRGAPLSEPLGLDALDPAFA